MSLQFYLEKLKSSKEYKKFIKENPDAYLCSGFFVLDKTGNDNKIHFDFYVPSIKKIFSFQLEDNSKIMPLENLGGQVLGKLDKDIDFVFGDIESIIYERIKKENIKNEIQKILLSLQRIGNKDFLIGTVFTSALSMVKINIDIGEKKITEFEKKSFFDMVRRVK